MEEIEELRNGIAAVDAEMARLFEERFALCAQIASIKKMSGMPVRVPEQEAKVIAGNVSLISDPLVRDYYSLFLQNEISLSREYQTRLLERDIVPERGALSRVGALCGSYGRVLVVTDEGVPGEYARTVAASFTNGASSTVAGVFTIPAGEGGKTLQSVSAILSELLSGGFTRKDAVVAVGGGVVGDVAGLAASLYMRGIDFINVPTTLLAMVDSSVGGKTAVNFGGVKNLAGAFHPPVKVIIDTDTLDTLSPRLFSEGVAEMIKMAATSSVELFSRLEGAGADWRREIGEMVKMALDIKLSVVRKDPFETGLRRVLNFGHTIGHAVEAASEGRLYHGECVAIGMLYMCSDRAAAAISGLLEKYGLPTADSVSADRLCELVSHDKKSSSNGVTAVWVEEIGTFEFRNLTSGDIRGLVLKHKL